MYDETQLKIMDATMTLIIDKGYSGATTKEIAKLAGVNECTIFSAICREKGNCDSGYGVAKVESRII